jgi:orotidine-5'-phosphate decarboxylase
MLRAAVEGLAETSHGYAGVLGVTVLTSLNEADLSAVGIASTPGKLVSRMSRLAADAGCEGVVCSPQELTVVGSVAADLIRVTPGVRPAGVAVGDQRRVMTPAEAIARGADWLVVGRPITSASDPIAAARDLAEELGIRG